MKKTKKSIDGKQMFWKLFCTTGKTGYYQIYKRLEKEDD